MVCWNTSQNGAQQKRTLNKIDPFICYKGTNKKKITKLNFTDLSCINPHIHLHQALMYILRMEVPASFKKDSNDCGLLVKSLAMKIDSLISMSEDKSRVKEI